jgi:hypothetical protein
LTSEIVRGNPKDSELFKETIEEVKKGYGKTPESSAADGGYAWKHYRQKVFWSVIGYNMRVMTAAVIAATL